MQKIRYRLVYNYAGHLNREGKAPVALECRQGQRKMYISSQVTIAPEQWSRGTVINHGNADKLTVWLIKWRNSVEEMELDSLLSGRQMSLYQLKTAVKTGMRASATVREFTKAVIEPSDRAKATKQSYRYLCNELEKHYGKMTLGDISHDMIQSWRNTMRKSGLSENTVKGRLKALRCIVNEAMKRNLITNDPFAYITIGNMTARHGYLTLKEIARLEALRLTRKEAHIRDAFVFACYTGLRFSDFRSMKSANITANVLSLIQQKTRNSVAIPLKYIFGGKPLEILSKYRSVEAFANIGCNTTVNRKLKELGVKANIGKRLFFHLARHSCASLLNQAGLQMQEIQKILGHSKLETTSKTYAETSVSQVSKSLRKAFKSRNISVV